MRYTKLNLMIIFIFTLICGCSEDKSDLVKIIRASPSPGTNLIKGTTVSFEFEIKYRLTSANNAVITLVVQDQNGKKVGDIQPSKIIGQGDGEIRIEHTLFIPPSVDLIEFFTPLIKEREHITRIVDVISYKVVSSSNAEQTLNIFKGENIIALKFPDMNLQGFLPNQKISGNAAEFYVEALNLFEQDQGSAKSNFDINLLANRAIIRKALGKIFDGAHIKTCDFTQYYPPFANLLKGKLPNFKYFEILAKTMSYCGNDFAQKNNYKSAMDTGLAIIAFGNHLRESAFTSTQYYWGIKIQKLGFESLAKIVTDLELQRKIDINLSLLNETENIFRKKQINLRRDAPYWQITPSLPENIIEFLHFIDDAEPIFRIEALQIISTWCDSNNYAQLQLEKDKNFWKFQNSLRDSLPKVKEKIERISMNDYDSRVKIISLIVFKELKIYK